MALFLVLGFLAILMIGSAAFFTLLNRSLDYRHADQKRQVCLGLAEGGMDKALAELLARRGAYEGEANTQLGDGAFTVEVLPGGGVYRIVSTGFLSHAGKAMREAKIVGDVVLAPDGSLSELRWTEVR